MRSVTRVHTPHGAPAQPPADIAARHLRAVDEELDRARADGERHMDLFVLVSNRASVLVLHSSKVAALECGLRETVPRGRCRGCGVAPTGLETPILVAMAAIGDGVRHS